MISLWFESNAAKKPPLFSLIQDVSEWDLNVLNNVDQEAFLSGIWL